MIDESYLDSVMHHSVLWNEWLRDKKLYSRVRSMIEDRKPFLNLLKKYIEYLSKREKNRIRVLEEGCGGSIDSCFLKKEFIDLDVYVIDLSMEAIKLSKKISAFMRVSLALNIDNAVSTKFESNYFDMIFSQGLIEHFDNPDIILTEQYRILKKDGLLIISIP